MTAGKERMRVAALADNGFTEALSSSQTNVGFFHPSRFFFLRGISTVDELEVVEV